MAERTLFTCPKCFHIWLGYAPKYCPSCHRKLSYKRVYKSKKRYKKHG